MRRLLALCFLATLPLVPAHAQNAADFPFTFYIHDSTGQAADTPLPSIYQFSATPLGSNSHILLKIQNTSTFPAYLGQAFVSSDPVTTVANTNFTVTGLASAVSIPVGGSMFFTLNFSPAGTGPITGYLRTSYQVQKNGCDFTKTVPAPCPGGVGSVSTVTGTGLEPQLVLSYRNSSGIDVLLQPSSTPVDFGDVSTSATSSIVFTLSNKSTLNITIPAISIPSPTTYTSSPFLLDTTQMPSSGVLAAGTSANITVTFGPGQTIFYTGSSLVIGSNTYPIKGHGIVVADVDALQISYVDSADKGTITYYPQPATPIPFTVNGSGSNILSFTVYNPPTSFNSVAVSSITVTGTGFTLGAVSPSGSVPADIAPGAKLTFPVSFAPTAYGTSTGRLTIGTRSFPITGTFTNPLLSGMSLLLSPSAILTSQEANATVTVQLASLASLAVPNGGNIKLDFVPSVAGVSDDPTVFFIANSGRELPLSVAVGAQTATYNNGSVAQSALPFQTGTTAGTLTFTVTFLNTPTFTQSFTISPALVQMTSTSAVRSSPNLVVHIAGYDNTYSLGKLNFTFYDTAGAAITSVPYDATSGFHDLFFGTGTSPNTTGGAFSLDATFPVTGDVAKVGSVMIIVNNSVGQTTATQTFQ